jgi:hypothetical protein
MAAERILLSNEKPLKEENFVCGRTGAALKNPVANNIHRSL